MKHGGEANSPSSSGKLAVVAAEDFWGSLARQLGGDHVDVKSLIALLGSTIRPLAQITLTADGPDADDALAALVEELGAAVSLSSDGAAVHP